MAEPGLDHERFHELDSEFHIRLARASHNALTSDLMQVLRDAVTSEMMAAFARVEDWEDTVAALTVDHRAILAAVEAGKGEEASELVARHIRGFYDAVGGTEAWVRRQPKAEGGEQAGPSSPPSVPAQVA